MLIQQFLTGLAIKPATAGIATTLTEGGMKAPNFALQDLERVLKQKCFTIDIDLHLGKSADTVYTCDCSFDYVKINSEYMT